jgi:MFS family permease
LNGHEGCEILPWRRTLYVLWVGQFLMTAGMSLVIPFLPLYIGDLGVHRLASVEQWTGLIFSATFMVSAFVQPLWGRLSDRVGRKVMLIRSGIGMAVIMAAMGLVHAVWQLFALRFIMGSVSGFISAAIALQASQTPPEEAGKALGTLQTGAVAGNLVGPLTQTLQ